MKWLLRCALAVLFGLAAVWAAGRAPQATEAGTVRQSQSSPCACPESASYPANLCREDARGFTDRFQSRNPRWNWGKTEGSGYHRRTSLHGIPAVEIGIGPGGGPDESDCSFEERALVRRWGCCFFRIRCSDANTDSGAGSMGWGVWKPGGASDLDAVWFISCSGASDEEFRGFQAMVVMGGAVLFRKTLAVDVAAPHDYRVEIAPESARFLVDGRVVAESGRLPPKLPCMKMVCWIDNKVVREQEGRASTVHGTTAVPKSLFLTLAGFDPAGR